MNNNNNKNENNKSSHEEKTIYTTNEAAELLGITLPYLYKLMCFGKIAYFKSKGGRRCYFKREDLEDWCFGVRIEKNKGGEQ